MKLTHLLKQKRFILSAEIVPPKNDDSEKDNTREIVEKRIKELTLSPPDFVSVTMGAGGSQRGGSLYFSYFIQEQGLIPLTHLTCRDYNPSHIENFVRELNLFDIKNILALRGDPPVTGKPFPPLGHFKYAHELVKQLTNLNQGTYLNNKKGAPRDFCLGVACHPEGYSEEPGNLEKAVEYLKIKIEKGAHFAITQMLFNPDHYSRFLEKAKTNIPIIPGIWPVTTTKNCEFAQNVCKVEVPSSYFEYFENHSLEDRKQFSYEQTLKLSEKLKQAGAPGIHIFLVRNFGVGKKILESLKGEDLRKKLSNTH